MSNLYKERLVQLKNDSQQYSAFTNNGNLVVIAGPGSGKTTVLTMKIMRLLKEKIKKPRGLACMTFSREAAREVRGRLSELGFSARENVFVGTVHGFCISQIITPYAHLYDYGISLPLRIISEGQRKKIFQDIVKKLSVDATIEEMDKERSLNIAGISEIEIPTYDVALRVAKQYEDTLRQLQLVDFVDIVKYSTLLIQNEEYVRSCLEAKFPWIVVDEYQDLGKPLHEMILALFYRTDIKLFIVGDPDQSIYSFAGAIPEYLRELAENPNIPVITLSTNYRSSQGIVDSAEATLGHSEPRYVALQNDTHAEFHFITCEREMTDQYNEVATNIVPSLLEREVPLHEICILVWSNREVEEMAGHLKNEKLPYYIPKHKGFERSDVVIWLEQCASWILKEDEYQFDDIFRTWLATVNSANMTIPKHDDIGLRRNLHRILSSSWEHSGNLNRWLTYVIQELDLIDLMERTPVYPDEATNLNKLLTMTREGDFSDFDLMKFKKLGKPENQITITTRHSSKGLEFEAVLILGMEEERFPSYRSLQDESKLAEERRVFFVCVTRAKRICYLLRSKTHTLQTRRGPWEREFRMSRFWKLLYEQTNTKS